LSTLSTASCGSAQQEVQRELLQIQQAAIKGAESARLRRQGGAPSNLVRCWLFARADNKFYEAVRATGGDPLGIMLNVILTVSSSQGSQD